MLDYGAYILTAIFSILFLVAPFIVNAFYQRRAQRFSDAMLKGDSAEFNRQIRANAVILLVRRSFWALFLFLVAILSFRHFLKEDLEWSLAGFI